MRKIILIVSAAAAAMFCAISCGQKGSEAAAEAENPVIEAIMNRRSIRQYQDRPVEREKLQLIAECGVWAPNGMNAQRWELRIVDNADMINGITEHYKAANPGMVERDPGFRNMFRNAPAIICVAVPQGDDGVNAGLLGENVMLAAHSLGLGTVALGGPVHYLKNSAEGQEFIERLKFSDGYELLYIIGVGYPNENPAPKERDLTKIKFVD